MAKGKTIRETIIEEKLLDPDEVTKVMDTYSMTEYNDEPSLSDEKGPRT
jgi:aspartate ammonia-lyase